MLERTCVGWGTVGRGNRGVLHAGKGEGGCSKDIGKGLRDCHCGGVRSEGGVKEGYGRCFHWVSRGCALTQ